MRTFQSLTNHPQPGRGGVNTICHDHVSARVGSNETAGIPSAPAQPSLPTWSATAFKSACARTSPKRPSPSAKKRRRNSFMCAGWPAFVLLQVSRPRRGVEDWRGWSNDDQARVAGAPPSRNSSQNSARRGIASPANGSRRHCSRDRGRRLDGFVEKGPRLERRGPLLSKVLRGTAPNGFEDCPRRCLTRSPHDVPGASLNIRPHSRSPAKRLITIGMSVT